MNTAGHRETWVMGSLQPQYTLKMGYSRYPGAPYYQACVIMSGWGLLAICQRDTARAAYKAGHRAIRAYARHGDIHYTGNKVA